MSWTEKHQKMFSSYFLLAEYTHTHIHKQKPIKQLNYTIATHSGGQCRDFECVIICGISFPKFGLSLWKIQLFSSLRYYEIEHTIGFLAWGSWTWMGFITLFFVAYWLIGVTILRKNKKNLYKTFTSSQSCLYSSSINIVVVVVLELCVKFRFHICMLYK